MERVPDPVLAPGSQSEQIPPADAAGIGAKCQGLDDVIATPDATVADDLQLVVQLVGNRRNAIDRRRG